jgi:S1-C subfamily serine protease
VNLLDLVIVAIAVLAAVNGFRRGAVVQLSTYAGLLAGMFAGALLAPALAGLVESPASQALVALVVLLSLAAVGDAAGWAVGRAIWAVTRRTPIAPFDHAAGSAVSVLSVLLAIWFVGLNLVTGPLPEVGRAIRGSAVMRALDDALPPPPPVLAEVRQFLDRFGFPQVFADLPPAPAGPVQGPTQGQAGRATDAADQSTLRVLGEACGVIQEGTGFVAAPDYVVTNAHVVAGVGTPTVQQQGGGSERGTTVLFDAALDIAIIRVGSVPAPPLPMLGEEVGRGAGGAVLGYPGGGGLTAGTAAVRSVREAGGRDIYGRSVVVRDVYELQAVVRSGNSGGPFVLASGRVAGVVFAASTIDPNVGYAITTPQVAPLLSDAQGRTDPVSTGPCIR